VHERVHPSQDWVWSSEFQPGRVDDAQQPNIGLALVGTKSHRPSTSHTPCHGGPTPQDDVALGARWSSARSGAPRDPCQDFTATPFRLTDLLMR